MGVGKKQKKVTVRHFLNKRLKPVSDGTEPRYSVYTRITYNRNSNEYRHKWKFNLEGLSEREYKNLFEGKGDRWTKMYIDETTKRIENIVKLEIDLFGESFKVKGIGERITTKYMEDVLYHLDTDIFTVLYHTLNDMDDSFFMVLNVPNSWELLEECKKYLKDPKYYDIKSEVKKVKSLKDFYDNKGKKRILIDDYIFKYRQEYIEFLKSKKIPVAGRQERIKYVDDFVKEFLKYPRFPV